MSRVAARAIVVVCGLCLAACVPNLPSFPYLAQSSPAVGSQPSSVPQSAATVPPSPASSLASTAAPTLTPAFTPIPTFTATDNLVTPVTQTSTAASPGPTATATFLESISLDKLPPGTVYKRVRIENQAREQMDISLHCTTVKGLHTVIEFSNVKNMTIQAPEGDYVYVFYVGGHRMIGSFSLLDVPSVTITVYKDRVAIH